MKRFFRTIQLYLLMIGLLAGLTLNDRTHISRREARLLLAAFNKASKHLGGPVIVTADVNTCFAAWIRRGWVVHNFGHVYELKTAKVTAYQWLLFLPGGVIRYRTAATIFVQTLHERSTSLK